MNNYDVLSSSRQEYLQTADSTAIARQTLVFDNINWFSHAAENEKLNHILS